MTSAWPYAVVTFLDEADFSDEDDDLTSEVPSTWLTANKTECWWPKTADANSYIIKRKLPVEDSRKWTLCNVRFEGYYENLEKARSAAATKKSESESSSTQCQSDKRYLRKKKQPLSRIREESTDRETSSESEDPKATSIPEPPSLNPKKNKQKSSAKSSTDPKSLRLNETDSHPLSQAFETWPIDIEVGQDFDIHADNGTTDVSSNTVPEASTLQSSANQSLGRPSILFDGTLTDFCNDSQERTRKLIEEKFSGLTTLLAQIMFTQQSVDHRLAEIEKKVGEHGAVRHGNDFRKVTSNLPFKNTADIQAFETKLADADFYSIFIKYIGQVGGNSAKENILRILRQVFTNDVAKVSSWCGLRANFQLSNLKVVAVIKDGVRLTYTCTDKDFEETVSEWFRQAKQRFKRENQKKNPDPHPAANNQ